MTTSIKSEVNKNKYKDKFRETMHWILDNTYKSKQKLCEVIIHLPGPIISFTVKEHHIGAVVSEILSSHRQTDR